MGIYALEQRRESGLITFLRRSRSAPTVAAGVLILISWLGARGQFLPSLWTNGGMILAALLAGHKIARQALFALRYRVLGIEALVTTAALGAILIGEYWEAAVVTFLFAFGSYLEGRTMDKSRQALRELLELAPRRATVIRDGVELQVLAEEVQKGETVLVRPGEKIPVDGHIIKGEASVNQAPITGESMPVEKGLGDGVYSGTIIQTGYLELVADKVGDDTTFSRIIHLVEEAQEKTAPVQRFVEGFARYYTPGIMVLAVLVYIITRDVLLALTLLVIACPGALVIATPISIVAGIGNAARRGVLVKGGEHLEMLGAIDVVVLDKTGTLTEGEPQVVGVEGFGVGRDMVLTQAAALERYSEHPLAKAIIAQANEEGLEYPPVDDFTVLTGHGVKGILEGKPVLLGNEKLLEREGLSIPEHIRLHLDEEAAQGRTVILLAQGRQIIGAISLADTIRQDARELVRSLKKAGVKETVMLTGDNPGTARAVAEAVGIDQFRAGVLPEDKARVIAELQAQGRRVAMVGDGINDAPAMAQADVGIAMGAIGTDVAIETADVALMDDRLSRLVYIIELSRAALKNIRQNLFFAVAVVFLLLAGVLGGRVILGSGMLIHELSVLLVILNATRLLKYQPRS
ncbi:MAG: heavy metal translocating P-type ATPase [Limnochordia bacterium]|jgi:Cd2+/Zn2+-exporting ATPase